MMSLLGPSGGLSYHYTALRNYSMLGGHAWSGFQKHLETWFRSRFSKSNYAGRGLTLMGPSAGYCLPWPLLRAQGPLSVIEPDTFAKFLLRSPQRAGAYEEIPSGRVVSKSQNEIVAAHEFFSPLRHTPVDRPIVFCNILGQICYLRPQISQSSHAIGWAPWNAEFLKAVSGRPWISFHDCASLEVDSHILNQAVEGPVSFGEPQEDLGALAEALGILKPGAENILWDHGTHELMRGALRASGDVTYLIWPLRRASKVTVQLIECVSSGF